MCLVALSYRTPEVRKLGYELVLIANRDEFFKRPAEPAHFWSDYPDVLAGRDLEAGGTWMGVARDARFALLTNYRDPRRVRPEAQSRGLLISDFLKARGRAAQGYLQKIALQSDRYNDFNLLAGSPDALFYLSSLNPKVVEIQPGDYGMSNHLFETPWPKVIRAREQMKSILAQGREISRDELFEKLFVVLKDPSPAPDDQLPETGVGLERERALSSIFITMPGYGTRCSTALAIRSDGMIEYSERTWPENRSDPPSTVEYQFTST